MKIFKELKKLGYKHYTEHTVEELNDLPLDSEERIMEQSLVFRWFREKHELTSEVCVEQYRRKTNKKWMFSITYLNKDAMYEHSKTTFETYEEAELACLEKLIEIVKNLDYAKTQMHQ